MSFVNKILAKFLGSKSERDIKEVMPIVEKIKEVYPEIEKLSNNELRERSKLLKQKVRDYIKADDDELARLKELVDSDEVEVQEKEKLYKQIDSINKKIDEKIEEVLNEILPEAFSIIKDTARRFTENSEILVSATDFDRDLAASKDFVDIRNEDAVYYNQWNAAGAEITWEMIHYDVQLIGGVVLHLGKIAEMATGEGKTLVATLPVFLNALAGKGVHLVTVNDYLAKRDSEWMGPIFQFHGLSVDCIDKHEPNSAARRKAYNADITYGTNNEFGFDSA